MSYNNYSSRDGSGYSSGTSSNSSSYYPNDRNVGSGGSGSGSGYSSRESGNSGYQNRDSSRSSYDNRPPSSFDSRPSSSNGPYYDNRSSSSNMGPPPPPTSSSSNYPPRDNYNRSSSSGGYGGSSNGGGYSNSNGYKSSSSYGVGDKDYRGGSSSNGSGGGGGGYSNGPTSNGSSSNGYNDYRSGSSSSSSSSGGYRSNGSIQPQQSITTPYNGGSGSSSGGSYSNGPSYNNYGSSSSSNGYNSSSSSSSYQPPSSSNGYGSSSYTNGSGSSSSYAPPPSSSAPGYSSSSSGYSNGYKSSYSSSSNYGGSSSYGGDSYKSNSYSSYGSGGGGGGSKYGGNDDFGSSLTQISWDTNTLSKFEKNFYQEAEEVSNMSPERVEEYRKSVCMTVKGRDIPNPITKFEVAPFPQYLMKEIMKAGFPSPTSIQAQAWPIALKGRDIIGLAETGSGKTLAFLLPSIIHINAQPQLQPGDGPIVLVLSPTRELAVQIKAEVDKFGGTSKISNCCVYGGAAKQSQISLLRKGVEILVATPGRLIDILSGGHTNLRRVTYLVLDEADRMLDMGFEKQIRSILSQIRPDRQTLMFSATWPKEVQSLANDYLVDHIQVHIGNADLTANHNVKQIVDVCDEHEKTNKLFKFMESINPNDKTIIFAETKRGVDNLQKRLQSSGFKSIGIHGDKSQAERDFVLSEFKNGQTPIMIATDLASRGLDVKDIKYVINFDFPNTIETYVHRIGRTGRAGATGTSFSLLTSDNGRLAKDLVDILIEAKQYVPQPLQNLIHAQPVHSIKPKFNPYHKRF